MADFPNDETRSFDIVALGELLVDFTDVGRTEDGRTLFERNPGGAPANVAVWAQRCGMRTAFIGKVGDDVNGRFLRSELAARGVDCTGVIYDDTTSTTLSFVELDDAGDRRFSFARKPGADTRLCRADVESAGMRGLIDRCRVLHIGTLSLTAEPARAATLQAVEIAQAAGCMVSLDPNYRASLWDDEAAAHEALALVLPAAHAVKVSADECALCTGSADPETAAARLVAGGARIAAVTLGARGSYVRTAAGGAFVEACPVRVRDTTGAGDAYWAGFLAELIARGCDRAPVLSLDRAVGCARAGSRTAARCVQRRGGM